MIMISNSIEGESLTLKYQPPSVFNEDNLQEAEIEKSTVLVSFSNMNKKNLENKWHFTASTAITDLAIKKSSFHFRAAQTQF